jgi:hypothetical protein
MPTSMNFGWVGHLSMTLHSIPPSPPSSFLLFSLRTLQSSLMLLPVVEQLYWGY